MIIHEINYSSGFFFKKPELIIKTSEGKTSLNIEITKEQVKELHNQLAGVEINSLEDLSKIEKEIKKVKPEAIETIQLGIINSSKRGWGIVNKNAKQVPRPVYSLLKKDIGVKEFFVLSLDARNFDTTLHACLDVSTRLNKKLSATQELPDDGKIFSYIKEAIDEVYKEVEFELRIGAVFDNYSNGNYIYKNKQIKEKEQEEFIEHLIDTYDLLYIENPFFEDSEETYKKFTEIHKNICLISIKSRINDYTRALNEEMCNTVVYNYTNLEDFKINIQNIKDGRANIITDADPRLVNLMVGFGIPMIKLDMKNSNEITRLVTTATITIQEHVANDKKQ